MENPTGPMLGPSSESELDLIRGKMLMEHPPGHDGWRVFGYIDWLEDKLNTVDCEDTLGTEGWRHFFEHPDAE